MSSCRQLKVTGRPVSREILAIQANSPSGSNMSLATSKTPAPASPMARPTPISSSADAVVPAASSPSLARWSSVRVVENPTAPASMASRTSAAIRSISSGVASALWPPRSPMT
jgi:hypothetical protein